MGKGDRPGPLSGPNNRAKTASETSPLFLHSLDDASINRAHKHTRYSRLRAVVGKDREEITSLVAFSHQSGFQHCSGILVSGGLNIFLPRCARPFCHFPFPPAFPTSFGSPTYPSLMILCFL